MINQKTHIAYVTGTRADFGLMTPVLLAIAKSKKLRLQVYATGVHLLPEFGKTFQEVKRFFPAVKSIQAVFNQDQTTNMADFIADFLPKLIKEFKRNRPDTVLVLGDRVEMLSVALACSYLRIPVVHLHGGDKTATIDDSARHAITKLAHIHLPATKAAAERLKRLGEEKWRIQVVGAPALGNILSQPLPTREVLLNKFGIDPKEKFILLTLHPIGELPGLERKQMRQVLAAVRNCKLPTIVIYPHPDKGGQLIIQEIESQRHNSWLHICPSVPQLEFLALEREAAVIVGNSSGAIIEAASFHTPVVNVGPRQDGRIISKNIITVSYNTTAIQAGITFVLTNKQFRRKLAGVRNPWGDGQTAPRVVKILENISLSGKILNKQITY